MNKNIKLQENVEKHRPTVRCDQLHPTCSTCALMKDRSQCISPKYFNNEMDISHIHLYCSKYKRFKK